MLGASGGAGLAILRELISQNKNVIGVNSSGKAVTGVNTQFIKADATDLAQLQQACLGASFIYNALNITYQQWVKVLPIFTKNIIQVASETQAKLIYVDNLYAYGPVNGPMTEDTPQVATDVKGNLRAEFWQTNT